VKKKFYVCALVGVIIKLYIFLVKNKNSSVICLKRWRKENYCFVKYDAVWLEFI